MKATIDQDTCTGCGLCVDTCPDVFEMGDDTAHVTSGEVPSDSEDTCRDAAADCPVEAISIQE